MTKMKTKVMLATLLLFGCGAATPETKPPPELPGSRDSSKTFVGALNANQSAYWESIRGWDMAARAEALAKIKADHEREPGVFYNAFLLGVDPQIPGSTAKREDAIPYLMKSAELSKDPLYNGFIYGFMGDGKKVAENNPVIAHIIGASIQMQMGQYDGAAESMFKLLDYCIAGTLDRSNPDFAPHLAKADATEVVHRECWSGWFAPHGTEGAQLFAGDLQALKGDLPKAKIFWKNAQLSRSYPTWTLKAEVEKRLSGELTVTTAKNARASAFDCQACHQK